MHIFFTSLLDFRLKHAIVNPGLHGLERLIDLVFAFLVKGFDLRVGWRRDFGVHLLITNFTAEIPFFFASASSTFLLTTFSSACLLI